MSNEIQTHNHLVRKRTLNHLAKLALKLPIWRLLREGVPWYLTLECRFTLKLVHYMIITYSQFVVHFKQASYIVLLFSLLILNEYMPAGNSVSCKSGEKSSVGKKFWSDRNNLDISFIWVKKCKLLTDDFHLGLLILWAAISG